MVARLKVPIHVLKYLHTLIQNKANAHVFKERLY